MSNLFYIYSDLTKNEIHYGYANSKPEISLRVMLNELVSSLMKLFCHEEPTPFYMRSIRSVETLFGFVWLVGRSLFEILLCQFWYILLILIVVFNYRIIQRYVADCDKLRLLRQIYRRTLQSKN